MKNQKKSIFGCGVSILIVALMLFPSICFAQQENQSANVKVALLKKGTISQSIVAYGTVIPAPGAVEVLSVPYESQVMKVFVSPGEQVSPGDLLVQMAPNPDTRLKVEMAKTAYKMAKARLDEIDKKQRLKLATNDEVFSAQQAFSDADLQLKNYQKMNATGPQEIRADRAGIVDNIYAHEGAVMPSGGPLVDVVAGGALEVRLGGEPEEVDHLKTGQTVLLTPVNRPSISAVNGRIRTISRSINTSTRLIDIFVGVDASAQVLLNEYVRGEITVAAAEGFIVPRSAILRSGDQYRLFTVKDNRAIQHIVQMGIENANEIQVFGEDITPGDPVVILGNYELADKMTVKVEGSR